MNIRKILLDVHMYLMLIISVGCFVTGIVTNEWMFYLFSLIFFELSIVMAATSDYIDNEIDKVKKRVSELENLLSKINSSNL